MGAETLSFAISSQVPKKRFKTHTTNTTTTSSPWDELKQYGDFYIPSPPSKTASIQRKRRFKTHGAKVGFDEEGNLLPLLTGGYTIGVHPGSLFVAQHGEKYAALLSGFAICPRGVDGYRNNVDQLFVVVRCLLFVECVCGGGEFRCCLLFVVVGGGGDDLWMMAVDI